VASCAWQWCGLSGKRRSSSGTSLGVHCREKWACHLRQWSGALGSGRLLGGPALPAVYDPLSQPDGAIWHHFYQLVTRHIANRIFDGKQPAQKNQFVSVGKQPWQRKTGVE